MEPYNEDVHPWSIAPEYRLGIDSLFHIHHPKGEWMWIDENWSWPKLTSGETLHTVHDFKGFQGDGDYGTNPCLVATRRLRDLAHAYIMGREAIEDLELEFEVD